MSSTNDALVTTHIKTLRLASFAAWTLTVALLYLSSSLPRFDSSPDAVLRTRTLRQHLAYPLLRWDAFHFVHIAREGYVYEHERAFLHGVAAAMRYPAKLFRLLGLAENTEGLASLSDLLLGGALLSSLCGSTTTLYHLTLHHFKSPSIAYLTALLSLLPSSPATLRFSVYNEPFFTYLSYNGMLSVANENLLASTVFFTAAASLRSNGIMLSGFIIWQLLVDPVLSGKRVSARNAFLATLSTIAISGPFILHQYSAYQEFCTTSTHHHPPWCSSTLPSIYSYVQAKYWNSGFLLYWTPAQLPNILLATPVLLSLFSYTSTHLKTLTIPTLLRSPFISSLFPALSSHTPPKPPHCDSAFFNHSTTPHAIHAFITCCILLFTAHTQIALRLAASMPATYWAAAWLVVEHPRWGRWWVAWSVVWGVVSVVLFAVFLPPA